MESFRVTSGDHRISCLVDGSIERSKETFHPRARFVAGMPSDGRREKKGRDGRKWMRKNLNEGDFRITNT